MQIVEVSMIGVRSAVLRLTRPGTPLRFEIFPMVHIGEPAFYAAVTERLRRCDLVVAEGVGSPGATEREAEKDRPARFGPLDALTASYRLPARFERSGLVEQDIPFDELGVPVRRPDMTGEQFAAGWRAVPVWQRAVALAAGPLAGLDRLAFGSRRTLARQLELSDTDWAERLLATDSLGDLMSLIGDQRDRLLIAELDEIHRRRGHEPITVAVVYGAAHAPPIIHAMRALHGYGVRGAEWLTVFELD